MEKVMDYEENIAQCSKNDAMQHLKPKLNGYMRVWSEVYIGATGNLQRRRAQHEQRGIGWRKMVVLYEAFTPQIAAALEADLIDYARRCNFRTSVGNVRDGGDGLNPNGGHTYVYLLVR
jgi:hypothetical protein